MTPPTIPPSTNSQPGDTLMGVPTSWPDAVALCVLFVCIAAVLIFLFKD